MSYNPWPRVAIVTAAVLGAFAGGFALLHGPIQHKVATQAAQHAFGTRKLNVLLLGYQDDEATTDTVVLMHLDVDRATATLMSIPRDTWVHLPGHGFQKINAAYAYGGTKASAQAVSALMGGIPIDATIALQPEGAAQIVDALGGLNVNVDEDMNYDDDNGRLHIHLKKGEQYLTGSQVVGYIRFRHDPASDYGRMHRQQQVMHLLLDQLSLPQNWAKLPRILRFARKDVQTTLSDDRLAALLAVYRNVPDDNVRAFTLPSKPGWSGDASVVFADKRWATLIGKLLFSKSEPPQDRILLANATGIGTFDETLLAALRGGGWNVPSSIDQPARKASLTVGSSPAAQVLAHTFKTAIKPGTATVLLVGADLAPDRP
jgi:polyisoprenyl-teichoic acid--peptidoglycan teichoic acid transferase